MNKSEYTTMKRKRRHAKVRAKVQGTSERPRLTVFRSNKNIYAQVIDDSQSVTLAQANDLKETKGTKQEKATAVGKAIAEAAKAKGVESVVFDRAGYLFAGRVKALAEGAREAGLKF
ncbi:MAG: 50S ribosomal protein L18 [Candidatus Pacebacteria bacterium]|nr:50S ribosomal protein L18 [Candidatus Paceibacterota bacterium]